MQAVELHCALGVSDELHVHDEVHVLPVSQVRLVLHVEPSPHADCEHEHVASPLDDELDDELDELVLVVVVVVVDPVLVEPLGRADDEPAATGESIASVSSPLSAASTTQPTASTAPAKEQRTIRAREIVVREEIIGASWAIARRYGDCCAPRTSSRAPHIHEWPARDDRSPRASAFISFQEFRRQRRIAAAECEVATRRGGLGECGAGARRLCAPGSRDRTSRAH